MKYATCSLAGRLVAVAVFGGLSGCAVNERVDFLEARLRDEEDRSEKYQTALRRSQQQLDMAEREAESLRATLAQAGSPVLPEQLSSLVQVSGIKFQGLMTGGQNRDGRPGDDVLSVVFFPHDEQGDLIKVGGTINIRAMDLTGTGGPRPVGEWSFPPAEARKSWHSGFLSSGYQFELPFQRPPQSKRLLIHVALTTPDGRTFEATHTSEVEPAGKIEPVSNSKSTRKPAPTNPPRALRPQPPSSIPMTQPDDDGVARINKPNRRNHTEPLTE